MQTLIWRFDFLLRRAMSDVLHSEVGCSLRHGIGLRERFGFVGRGLLQRRIQGGAAGEPQRGPLFR